MHKYFFNFLLDLIVLNLIQSIFELIWFVQQIAHPFLNDKIQLIFYKTLKQVKFAGFFGERSNIFFTNLFILFGFDFQAFNQHGRFLIFKLGYILQMFLHFFFKQGFLLIHLLFQEIILVFVIQFQFMNKSVHILGTFRFE